MLNQKLQQKLQQKLSPQQIQLMKLLQLPTTAMEQRIKEELEENPALEDSNDTKDLDEEEQNPDISDTPADEEDNENDELENEIEEAEKDPEEVSFEDYLEEDDTPDYKLNSYEYNPDEDEHKEIPFSVGQTFHETLETQLGLRKLNEPQRLIASYIIGNIDDSGYLQRDLPAMVDDLAFTHNINTAVPEMEELLKIIQEFEPYGVGARNLQECLLIQLERKENFTGSTQLAKTILQKCFTEFTKKHYDKIEKKLDITGDELKSAINEIIQLNPKPGSSLIDNAKPNQYIVPDFYITNTDGQLDLSMNSKNTPELRVSKAYLDMIETLTQNKKKNTSQQKDLAVFVKQKLDSARWFIDMIKQRHDTLFRTMKAIMEHQKEYFVEGDETRLKPMILKDIAEKVNLDISTISRVVNSKYVQTPFGTFLLKSFFSESLLTESGEEVSTREVKKILSDCIASENKRKPLTDDQLTKILKNKGYNIARRTVAKYREQLEIPVARLRKEL
ncbi:MAG: RNA polymerase factor sigma-54 [Bacteroidales bacterium]|jgi:RNA polymerase sigma-54 factor|nr:RNA polymerase factor sigma-54 [Bacteroidales bacterium]MDD4213458.1 RNA polymerase factor sigma-54 [Bacteroidales bacterium]